MPTEAPQTVGFATPAARLVVRPGVERLIRPDTPVKPTDNIRSLLQKEGCQLASPMISFIDGTVTIPPSSENNDDAAEIEEFLRKRYLMWDQFSEWKAKYPAEFTAP